MKPLYSAPELYQASYGDLPPEELAYYAEAASHFPSALEIGCGQGRLLLALAAALPSTQFIGTDTSEAMLAQLWPKLSKATTPNVSVYKTEGWSVRPNAGPTPQLIYAPAHVLHHCHAVEDMVEFLLSASRRAGPNGLLILDFHSPEYEIYTLPPGTLHHQSTFPVGHAVAKHWEISTYNKETQVHHVLQHIEVDGVEHTFAMDFRVWFPQELRAIFKLCGLQVIECLSGFPGTTDTHQMIFKLSPSHL